MEQNNGGERKALRRSTRLMRMKNRKEVQDLTIDLIDLTGNDSDSDVELVSVVPAKEKPNKRNFKCPICLECYLNRKPNAAKCGHIFCEECIWTAMYYSIFCPVCKFPSSPISLRRLYLF